MNVHYFISKARLLISLVLGGAMVVATVQAGESVHTGSHEIELMNVMQDVADADLGSAMRNVETILKKVPNSRLANLMYGDLLTAMVSPVEEFGAGISGLKQKQPMRDLLDEVHVRWRHQKSSSAAHKGYVPVNLLDMGPHKWAVFVDLSESRVYVFSNQHGVLKLERDYYGTMGVNGAGKQILGDKRTPVGVYNVVSHLPGSSLPDLYGSGAFPINYPNAMDLRHQRTGSGIWLHGTPSNTYNRAPRASDGCVVLSNPDFEELRQYVNAKTGTPVIIVDKVEWVSLKHLAKHREQALSALETWRSDWESLDTERYLAHYSKDDFVGFGKDYASWAKHKRRVNKHKKSIKVDLEVKGLFIYPGEQNTVLTTFVQDYRSDNFNGKSHKHQYWRRDQDGVWRIIYEGRA